jgi:hypothetical protein
MPSGAELKTKHITRDRQPCVQLRDRVASENMRAPRPTFEVPGTCGKQIGRMVMYAMIFTSSSCGCVRTAMLQTGYLRSRFTGLVSEPEMSRVAESGG